MDIRGWMIALAAAILSGVAGWRSSRNGTFFKEEVLKVAAAISLLVFVSANIAEYVEQKVALTQAKLTLTGKVTDTDGRAIEHASVRLIERDTRVEEDALTNLRGEFFFRGLLPGKYEVTVAADGFQSAMKVALTLVHDDYLTLPIQPAARRGAHSDGNQTAVAWQ